MQVAVLWYFLVFINFKVRPMKKFFVSFTLETSENAESDLQLAARVDADNWRKALVVAKNVLKAEHPNLNLAKIWFWSVECRPQSM